MPHPVRMDRWKTSVGIGPLQTIWRASGATVIVEVADRPVVEVDGDKIRDLSEDGADATDHQRDRVVVLPKPGGRLRTFLIGVGVVILLATFGLWFFSRSDPLAPTIVVYA